MRETNLPKILYIIDSLTRSGAEQSLVSMLPHLISVGLRLEVAYLVERPGLHDELAALGVTTHAITAPKSRLARIRALRHVMEERQPCLVHTTLFESDIAGRIAARLSRRPSVSSLVNVAYGAAQKRDRNINTVKLFAARQADRLTARLPVRFHALTEHVAETMSAELNIPRHLIDVIPRGRDRASLGVASPERRAVVRGILGLRDHDRLILAAARHEFQKGLDLLIAAMPRILQAEPAAVLLIAGREGAQTTALAGQVRDLGLEARVRLLGMRSDVPDLMAAADVLALPSRWEGFGSVLLEAMALKLPIVATDLVPVREVVGGGALYCPPDDSAALGEALAGVFGDPAGASTRVQVAEERFEARYTMERVAAAMTAFYMRAQDVAQGGHR